MPRAAGNAVGNETEDLEAVVAGAVAGLVSRFVIAPLDVIKIRLQLQHHHPGGAKARPSLTYKGIIPTARTIIQQEGFTALWKGNVPAELLYLTYGASQFYTYRNVQELVNKSPYPIPMAAQSFIAGGSAGAAATSVTYPFDLLRTRFAAQGSGTSRIYTSLAHSIAHIYRYEGWHGFYRGFSAAVGQIVPYMGLLFATYEPTRALLLSLDSKSEIGTLSGWESAVAGGFASVVAKTGVFPLDLVRRRLQVQGPTREKYLQRNIPLYEGVFMALRHILKREGYRGLYRGLAVSLLKAAPSSAVTMWTFEQTMKLLRAGRKEVGLPVDD